MLYILSNDALGVECIMMTRIMTAVRHIGPLTERAFRDARRINFFRNHLYERSAAPTRIIYEYKELYYHEGFLLCICLGTLRNAKRGCSSKRIRTDHSGANDEEVIGIHHLLQERRGKVQYRT
jgi:hypothetical protein